MNSLRLSFGSPRVSIDLVAPDLNLEGAAASKRDVQSFWFPTQTPGGTFDAVPILGELDTLPYLPRSANETEGEGLYDVIIPNKFANGSDIANGSYKVLLRALKVTGDPAVQADYESWLSPILVFNYTAPPPPPPPETTTSSEVPTSTPQPQPRKRNFWN